VTLSDVRSPDALTTFQDHRGVLMGLAYRMLGQVADAEDVVQETWLRWSRVATEEVEDARAYLVRVTTRLAIDRLRRIRARREDYVGTWLPEPIPSAALSTEVDPGDQVILAETLSTAMLVVLETLSPVERAVFILREVFGYSHAEVAEAIGRSEPAVRQLAHRARGHIAERRPRFEADPAIRRDITQRFMAASRQGDLDALMALLAPDVEFVADGGGQVRAPLLPVRGAVKVTRFMLAAGARMTPDQTMTIVDLNGGPWVVAWTGATPTAAATIDVEDGRIVRVWLVGAPDKLRAIRAT
jgi:RNA polymerase sigma-70 factor (ECF subfamily)